MTGSAWAAVAPTSMAAPTNHWESFMMRLRAWVSFKLANFIDCNSSENRRIGCKNRRQMDF
jgi:hypothetical protein